MAIPTKAELAKKQADQAASDAVTRENNQYTSYRQAIIDAMNAGKSEYSDPIGNVTPNVQARLRTEFGSEWTLEFDNARTGCTITWK
jgi:hypothetical protein